MTSSPSQSLAQSQPAPPHLILVCCHAIYIGPPSTSRPTSAAPSQQKSSSIKPGRSDTHWLLAPFQSSESITFTSHAQAGLSLLYTTPNSLLVFSGSKTNPSIDKSEAQSYLDLCVANSFFDPPGFGSTEHLKKRIILETQALDSFGNLLFSLLAFWKERKEWPQKVTIVTHEFKKQRFLKCHIPALRLNPKDITIHGIDPEYMRPTHSTFNLARAEEVRSGEKERGFKVWKQDPLGKGKLLRQKRRSRNYWKVSQEWFADKGERLQSGVVSDRKCWEDEKKEMVLEEMLVRSVRQPWEVLE